MFKCKYRFDSDMCQLKLYTNVMLVSGADGYGFCITDCNYNPECNWFTEEVE